LAERETQIAGKGRFYDSQIALHNIEKLRDGDAGVPVPVWDKKVLAGESNFLRQDGERNKGGMQGIYIHSVSFHELCDGPVTAV
jgi:hypothetical protein